MLRKLLSFTSTLFNKEHENSEADTSGYPLGEGLKSWPLNKPLVEEIESDSASSGLIDFGDVMSVTPHRSQMRAVVIFAVPVEVS
jgi:hypothetical protein